MSTYRDIQQKTIREGHSYFPDPIQKEVWHCFIDFKYKHHNLGNQIKILYKLMSVRKGNLFSVFYLRFARVSISHSANKGKKITILRFYCLCCFRTSLKFSSNLNLFLNVFKRYCASTLKVSSFEMQPYCNKEFMYQYAFFPFVEPGIKNRKSVYQ